MDWERNAGATVAQSPVPAILSAGLETIAAAKGPAGLMAAATERLEEQADMSVLKSHSLMPSVFFGIMTMLVYQKQKRHSGFD